MLLLFISQVASEGAREGRRERHKKSDIMRTAAGHSHLLRYLLQAGAELSSRGCWAEIETVRI